MIRSVLCLMVFGLLQAGCQSSACSPCPPGTRASNPSESCSTCVCVDGGARGSCSSDGSAHDGPG